MELHTPQSLSRIHGLSDRPQRPGAFRRYVADLRERLEEAARRHADRERLMAMSERELDDIGLIRADVIDAFDRSQWPFRSRNGGPANA